MQDAAPELNQGAPTADKRLPDKAIIQLSELIYKFATAEEKSMPARNLFNLVIKSFPEETLPIMARLSDWDKSGAAAFLYARAAFQKDHIKLAHKVIQPLLDDDAASDVTLMLGARICVRLNDGEGAEKLLRRVSAEGSASKGVEEVRAKIGQLNKLEHDAPKVPLKKRASS